jgi:putative FmdB family regulatory protein
MPTYEYACRSCGQHLEVVQSFKDDALTECPHCQGALRKVFSAAGIIFKGSGWHVKDYASTGAKAGGSSDTSSGDGDSGSSGSSSASGSSSDGSSAKTDTAKSSGTPEKKDTSSSSTSTSGSDVKKSA